MGKLCAIIFIFVILFTGSFTIDNQATAKKNSNVIPGKYIVVFNDEVSEPWSVANEMGLKNGLSVSHIYSHSIKGFSGAIPDAKLAKISSDPRVSFIEEDRIITIEKSPWGTPPGKNKDKNNDPKGDPPTVTIISPNESSSFTEGDSITFNGIADDTEDGDISDNISWNSDIDGVIGSGTSFSSSLSVGIHIITASVTDTDGNSDSDSNTITVSSANGDPPIGDQIIPTGILRINGYLSSTISGDGIGTVNIDVAVIDTGIDTDHEDLNVVGGKNCRGKQSKQYNDDGGHGTHVAGIIGALDNDLGIVGVAPGAKLHAVKVLSGGGSGTFSDVICGIDWVASKAGIIEVANLSLTGFGSDSQHDLNDCESISSSLHAAVCKLVKTGVTVVVAAGNSKSNAENYVPAAYDEVITVSGLADFNGEPNGGAPYTCKADIDDTFYDSSNYGPDIDIIAPAVCILSTVPIGACINCDPSGYMELSGTSMASPHVAGAAALYIANNPGALPAEVQTALENAGNYNWSGDKDSTKEPLLDVGGL